MKQIIFPVLHGVQTKVLSDHFADEFIEGVKSYLSEEEKEYLIPLPYNWTHTTQHRQMQIYNAVESNLWNQKLRKLKHTLLANVAWYNRTKSGTGFFNTIHKELDELIEKKLQIYPDANIVIFGHSLGSQMAFNFCWETRIKKIDGIFLAGSPFAMYSGMFSDWGRVPANLSKFIVNFYNKMDFLSSRIQGVHPSKEIADFAKDYEVPLGWKPNYWLTLDSHGIYWKSKFVWKIVAEYLKDSILQQ